MPAPINFDSANILNPVGAKTIAIDASGNPGVLPAILDNIMVSEAINGISYVPGSSYVQRMVGAVRAITSATTFNAIKTRVWLTSRKNVEWKLYRKLTSSFAPIAQQLSTYEIVDEGNILGADFPVLNTQNLIILNKTITIQPLYTIVLLFRCANGDSSLAVGSSTTGNGERGLMFSTTSSWDGTNTILEGSTGYYSGGMSLLKVAADANSLLATVNDVASTMTRIETQASPRMILPATIYAVVGDTLQVFKSGVLEDTDTATNEIEFDCNIGKDYPRYFEVTPLVGDVGDHTLMANYYNKDGSLCSTASCTLKVKSAVSAPASNINVMCVGDSLTAGGQWPSELQRMLAQAGGAPVGKEYANITFVGDKAGTNTDQKWVGTGGWTTATYLGNTSPFWDSGQSAIDFNTFCTANSFGSLGVVYLLLGWNTVITTTTQKPLAVDWATQIADVKLFIDALHRDFPSCKCVLIGLQGPSILGGLAANYGSDSINSHYLQFLRNVNGYNLALEAVTLDALYSGFVRFIGLACQYDAINNILTTTKAVNTRNTVTELIGTNGVHPSTSGYMQIADVAYRDFISNHCQG